MFSDFVLLNRPGREPLQLREGNVPLTEKPWFFWQTCMRQVLVLPADQLHEIALRPDDQIFRGIDAFRYCLEVACGLHSPLVGETEVYGQFKAAVAAYRVPDLPWGVSLRRFFQAVFEDAKKVRQTHLVDLGSQSYGSVVRRELREIREIHVIGAGHLAQEIMPWIAKDGAVIHIHCRNPEKARPVFAGYAEVRIHSLSEAYDGKIEMAEDSALIVAAPLNAHEIGRWAGPQAPRFARVLDLRGDSHEDELNGFPCVLNLRQLFGLIDGNQARVQARKQAALKEIVQLTLRRGRHIEYRPFGWEDVCA